SRPAGPAGDYGGARQVDRGSPGLSLSLRLGRGLGLELGRRRSSDVWIGFWLERRGSGRTGQRDLPGCDAVEPPFVQRLALGTDERFGARLREDRDTTLWFYDDTAQPQLELGISGLTGYCPIPRAPG